MKSVLFERQFALFFLIIFSVFSTFSSVKGSSYCGESEESLTRPKMIGLSELSIQNGQSLKDYFLNQFNLYFPQSYDTAGFPSGIDFNTQGKFFHSYSKTGVSVWKDNWMRSHDFSFSALAFDDAQRGTMITRRYGVVAKHYDSRRTPGSKIYFVDPNGQSIERTIEDRVRIEGNGDTTVIRLSTPLPCSIEAFPLLGQDVDLAPALGIPVLMTNARKQLLLSELDSVVASTITYRSPQTDSGFYQALISGDSGDMTFLIAEGQPVFLSMHQAVFGSMALESYQSGESLHERVLAAIDLMEERNPDSPSPCLIDLNGDSVLNVDDVSSFVSYFLDQDFRADIDASGMINVDDVIMFAELFKLGCS